MEDILESFLKDHEGFRLNEGNTRVSCAKYLNKYTGICHLCEEYTLVMMLDYIVELVGLKPFLQEMIYTKEIQIMEKTIANTFS